MASKKIVKIGGIDLIPGLFRRSYGVPVPSGDTRSLMITGKNVPPPPPSLPVIEVFKGTKMSQFMGKEEVYSYEDGEKMIVSGLGEKGTKDFMERFSSGGSPVVNVSPVINVNESKDTFDLKKEGLYLLRRLGAGIMGTAGALFVLSVAGKEKEEDKTTRVGLLLAQIRKMRRIVAGGGGEESGVGGGSSVENGGEKSGVGGSEVAGGSRNGGSEVAEGSRIGGGGVENGVGGGSDCGKVAGGVGQVTGGVNSGGVKEVNNHGVGVEEEGNGVESGGDGD